MKRGIAKPETNTMRSITMPARVITPMDAYILYSQGSPIDRMAGYYKKQGLLNDDFYMMDQVGRLKALADYRALAKELGSKVEILQGQENELKAQQRQAQEDAQYNAWKERFQAEQVTKQP